MFVRGVVMVHICMCVYAGEGGMYVCLQIYKLVKKYYIFMV